MTVNMEMKCHDGQSPTSKYIRTIFIAASDITANVPTSSSCPSDQSKPAARDVFASKAKSKLNAKPQLIAFST